MFTGLVEEVASISAVSRREGAVRLGLRCALLSEDARLGDSLAVNGACLTVVARRGSLLEFDAVLETVRRTNLNSIRPGTRVNLERSLPVGGRLGGHFVTGHVDGTGRLLQVSQSGQAHVLRIGAPPELMRFVAVRGSVALDGVSLTVVDVLPDSFTVWLIPHTRAVTTLAERTVGDVLNLETDILARYVARLLESGSSGHGLTAQKLAASGFLGD